MISPSLSLRGSQAEMRDPNPEGLDDLPVGAALERATRARRLRLRLRLGTEGVFVERDVDRLASRLGCDSQEYAPECCTLQDEFA